MKVDIDGNVIDPGSTRLGISKAGYLIHSAIHSARKDIRCIIHLHTAACAAVSSMKYGLLSLCQESLVVRLDYLRFIYFCLSAVRFHTMTTMVSLSMKQRKRS